MKYRILFLLIVLVISFNKHCAFASRTLCSGDGEKQMDSMDNGSNGAYYTGAYLNLFDKYLGISKQQTNEKINQIWNHFFVNEGTKIYFEGNDNTAYIYDTGNRDVRTEGMSYGMMICVQLNKQKEFDKLWRWVKKNMLYTSGKWKGYFAWQCETDGRKVGYEPSCAPDGEAYFIMSLFFASHQWGNDGTYDYGCEAQEILKNIMSKDGTDGVFTMFNRNSKLITFVPSGTMWNITDPSYNIPAFFELWAIWADTNKDFWQQAPDAARCLLVKASHPETGLFPDYSTFEGKPYQPEWKKDYDARRFQFDAIRCAMNIGMDYYWFGKDADNQIIMMTRLLTFFKRDNFVHGQFNWDGTEPDGPYSEGMAGANAVGAFALKDETLKREYLQRLWDTPIPVGTYRYYNGMVYMLSMLHVTGNFKIIKPSMSGSD
ncbi:glycosyl hydrolase family 8 [Bacteroides sp.]|uniref:glycosyl hydrolase family 8 n=1 Tax=Bacteroides sp. TaxID=29523 RepID=UPI00261C9DD0|nr:glycosyl hydrolase family 8 [Bacteroides sp.]MDD3040321.1 glycosyl hydrolase family 8 [Bacteroides sp.]